MYNYWGNRTDTGLCEPLWSIRLNFQLMAELEMIYILQAQVCGYALADTTGKQGHSGGGLQGMHPVSSCTERVSRTTDRTARLPTPYETVSHLNCPTS